MSHWHTLLDRAIRGLESLKKSNVTPEDWTLGGGTALMLHHQHRMSQDIDIFIDDAQYLAFLSPRLGGEAIWNAEAYDEAAHYLKLRYPEGEIDFIVSGMITETVILPFDVAGDIDAGIPDYRFLIEHPVEIALKKLWYRGADLKVRDVFDIAVVAEHHERLLLSNLHYARSKKTAILDRLNRIDPGFFMASIDELDIMPAYEALGSEALRRFHAVAAAI